MPFARIIDKYLKIILMDTYEIPGLKDFILPCSLQASTVRGLIFSISAASSLVQMVLEAPWFDDVGVYVAAAPATLLIFAYVTMS